MRVRVEQHNPQWIEAFAQLQSELKASLEGVEVISIEHVGSTSVPGLAAKPIIDIDVIVVQSTVPDAIAALTDKGGYKYMGDWGIEHRHVLQKPGAQPERNLYVCVGGCAALKNHLSVRDTLRKDAKLRDEYGKLKLELAELDHAHIDEYTDAKDDVIRRILEGAGLGPEEREQIRMSNVNNRR